VVCRNPARRMAKPRSCLICAEEAREPRKGMRASAGRRAVDDVHGRGRPARATSSPAGGEAEEVRQKSTISAMGAGRRRRGLIRLDARPGSR